MDNYPIEQTFASLGEYCQCQKTETDKEKIEQAYNFIWTDCQFQQKQYVEKYAPQIEKISSKNPEKLTRSSLEIYYQKTRTDIESISQMAEKRADEISGMFRGFATQEGAKKTTCEQIKSNTETANDLLKTNYIALCKEARTQKKALAESSSPEVKYLLYSSNIIYSVLEKNRDALIEQVNVMSREIETRDNQKLPLSDWINESNNPEKATDGTTISPDDKKSEKLTTELQRPQSEKSK